MTRSQPRQATISTRIKGCDNLDIRSTAAADHFDLGAVVLNGSLTAKSSVRLASLSGAYQRIKWHNLKFTIEGAYPTLAGGGYICCFVRDATDLPPSDPLERVRWAMAQQHSADAKWYDSVALNVGAHPDLQYTSTGDGLRFSSPGTFYVISKGGPAQVGTLTINFHWDVTLSEPTTESSDVTKQLVAETDIYLRWGPPNGNYVAATVTTPSADPHAIAYADYSVSPIEFPAGGYFKLKLPTTVTGEYSTGNDYIPIEIDGFAVAADGKLHATYKVAGQYYIIGAGVASTTFGVYQSSFWHLISGGTGAVVKRGEELEYFESPVLAGGQTQIRVFTPKGIRHLDGSIPEDSLSQAVAQIRLLGEA
jgi:hypothetical protein